MIPLPKINKTLLIRRTREAVKKEPLVQQALPGFVAKRIEDFRSKVIRNAFIEAEQVSREHTTKYLRAHPRANYEKRRRVALARVLSDVYGWKILFGEHGFVSKDNLHKRKKLDKRGQEKRINKKTGKEMFVVYAGVDSALHSLLKAGLTTAQLERLTKHLIFGYNDYIKALTIRKKHDATPAAQLYREKIRDALINEGIIPYEMLGNEERMARIDHSIIYILSLATSREHGARMQKRIVKERSEAKTKSIEEERLERLMYRRDVQELLAKGVPFEQIQSMFPKRELHEKRRKKEVK